MSPFPILFDIVILFFQKPFKIFKRTSIFNFLMFCSKLYFQKAERVPRFTTFGYVRFLGRIIFRLNLGFLNIYPRRPFFNFFSGILTLYPNIIAFYYGGSGGLKTGVIRVLHILSNVLHILSNLRFLSLRYNADFGRSCFVDS